jgi:hypothetical protein
VPNKGAAERVEDQELEPLDHLAGNSLVGKPGDERGDAARLRIVARRVGAHDA